MTFRYPEEWRWKAREPDPVPNGPGVFIKDGMRMIATTGEGWEHVAASHDFRAPNWSDVCFVKALFWDPEDCVVPYHPFESNVLHLWRRVGFECEPRPLRIL
jgi:hypothetical protein